MLHGSSVGTSQELGASASITSKPCPRRIDASNERSVRDKPTIRRHGFRAIILPPTWFPNGISSVTIIRGCWKQDSLACHHPLRTRGLGWSPAHRRQTALKCPAGVETPTRSTAPASCSALGERRGPPPPKYRGPPRPRMEQSGETTAPGPTIRLTPGPSPLASARGVTWGMTHRPDAAAPEARVPSDCSWREESAHAGNPLRVLWRGLGSRRPERSPMSWPSPAKPCVLSQRREARGSSSH